MNKAKTLLFIVSEGPTDEEYYAKVLSAIKSIHGGAPFQMTKIEPFCAKGIGNMAFSISRKYANDICVRYSNYRKTVVFCYDTDVFGLNQNPPVDWKQVEKECRTADPNTFFIHIKAKKSIEDVFLNDPEGICSFLRLKKNTSIPEGKDGYHRLQSLFKKANKHYIKGEKVEGFVRALNIYKLMAKQCASLKPLCTVLGYPCLGQKCLEAAEVKKK